MKILATLTLILLTLAIGHPASAQESARKFDLQASSPKFWRMIPPDAKLQTVATGFGFTEGPGWDPAGSLYVTRLSTKFSALT